MPISLYSEVKMGRLNLLGVYNWSSNLPQCCPVGPVCKAAQGICRFFTAPDVHRRVCMNKCKRLCIIGITAHMGICKCVI